MNINRLDWLCPPPPPLSHFLVCCYQSMYVENIEDIHFLYNWNMKGMKKHTESDEKENLIFVIILLDQTEEWNFETEKSLDTQTPALTCNASKIIQTSNINSKLLNCIGIWSEECLYCRYIKIHRMFFPISPSFMSQTVCKVYQSHKGVIKLQLCCVQSNNRKAQHYQCQR